MSADEWGSLFEYIFPPPHVSVGRSQDGRGSVDRLGQSLQRLHLRQDRVDSSPRYLEDTYLFEMPSRISSVARSEDSSRGSYKVTLTETLFHPQGGGQPSDTGWISIDDGLLFEVHFAQKNGTRIEHLGDFSQHVPNIADLFDRPVVLRVDAQRRLANARLHSGGHLLDAAIARCGLAEKLRPSKGYHFADGPYVEYTSCVGEPLPTRFVEEVNQALSQLVEEGIPTEVQVLSRASAREVLGEYLESYPDQVRVVRLAGLACPCGGTHLRSTAELRGIVVTKVKAKQSLIRVSYSFQ